MGNSRLLIAPPSGLLTAIVRLPFGLRLLTCGSATLSACVTNIVNGYGPGASQAPDVTSNGILPDCFATKVASFLSIKKSKPKHSIIDARPRQSS